MPLPSMEWGVGERITPLGLLHPTSPPLPIFYNYIPGWILMDRYALLLSIIAPGRGYSI